MKDLRTSVKKYIPDCFEVNAKEIIPRLILNSVNFANKHPTKLRLTKIQPQMTYIGTHTLLLSKNARWNNINSIQHSELRRTC